MKWTEITGNGNSIINKFSGSVSGEVTIYRDDDYGGASVLIGFLDSNGQAVEITGGTFVAGEHSKRLKIGSGVDVVAIVTSFTTNFSIGYAPG